MKKKLIIVGNGTTAETVYNFVEKYKLFEVIGFAVHQKYHETDCFLGLKNYCLEDLTANDDFLLFIAMQWNRLNRDRRDIYDSLEKKGFKFANIISPNAIIHGTLEGTNCWIADKVLIENKASIGANTFIKSGASISTRATVGSHCFIGMHTVIGGAASLGEQIFIGINSTVFDEVKIGDKCLVGACSIVKRNLPPFSKLVVKTECIIKTYNEDKIEQKLLFHKNIR